jgi:hypothetical protein
LFPLQCPVDSAEYEWREPEYLAREHTMYIVHKAQRDVVSYILHGLVNSI